MSLLLLVILMTSKIKCVLFSITKDVNFNLDNAQYLEVLENYDLKRNFQHFSVCGEGEINFKLSRWSFIWDFTDNAASEGGPPDITSTMEMCFNKFKINYLSNIAIFHKNIHDLWNIHKISQTEWKKLLSFERRNFVWEFTNKPAGECDYSIQ